MFIALELSFPRFTARLLLPEQFGGIIEHASNVLVLLDAVLWAAVVFACRRERRGPLLLALAATAYLVFATMEELDWGRVWNLNLGHELVARLAWGRVNFHDARWGGLAAPLVFAPAIAFFAASLIPSLRDRWARLAPVSATRVEALAFMATLGLMFVLETARITAHRLPTPPTLPNGIAYRPSPVPFCQCQFYVLFALVALRVWRDVRRTEG